MERVWLVRQLQINIILLQYFIIQPDAICDMIKAEMQ